MIIEPNLTITATKAWTLLLNVYGREWFVGGKTGISRDKLLYVHSKNREARDEDNKKQTQQTNTSPKRDFN
jgi:hypothetical protein